MSGDEQDPRAKLTQAEFLQIFRWQRQIDMGNLAVMTGISPQTLTQFEENQGALRSAAHHGRLAEVLGMESEIWERVGIDPGYPGSPAGTKGAAKGQGAFVEQINRIAALPDSWRARQMQVIRKELAFLDKA